MFFPDKPRAFTEVGPVFLPRTPHNVAVAYCEGTPLRNEVESSRLSEATRRRRWKDSGSCRGSCASLTARAPTARYIRRMPDPIDSIRHDAPCSVPWAMMAGDDRVRHCMSCDLNVYNFAELTRDEIREVIAQSNGRLCTRLRRRADGTLVTRSRSRLPRALTAALLGIAALASSCASKAGLFTHSSKIAIDVEQIVTPQQQAQLTGFVRDAEGHDLPGVTVMLWNESTREKISVVSGVNGDFAITPPEDGLYLLDVNLPGFGHAVREHLQLRKTEVTRARVVLRAGLGESITVGGSAIDPITESGVTTTFTQDLVNKLPL